MLLSYPHWGSSHFIAAFLASFSNLAIFLIPTGDHHTIKKKYSEELYRFLPFLSPLGIITLFVSMLITAFVLAVLSYPHWGSSHFHAYEAVGS
jgi:hypothetical protein